MAFFSNNNIIATKHKTFPFTGKWLNSFGEPPVSGSWIIYGGSGSGKTSFVLQLAKYLTTFDRVLYWSLEQGNSKTFQLAWMRENMAECGTDIMLADEEVTFEMIIKTMCQPRGRNILIIDSLTPLKAQSFNVLAYEKFRKRMKGKVIIWISHEKGGLPDTKVGDYILKLADLKCRCEGYTVFTNTRAGDKMEDFVIWEKGAREYDAE
jgi:GTPase SAR1 family protein